MEGAKQGIVVAGGQGKGNELTQLSYPQGVIVDQLGTVYVADSDNDRIMRWPKGATQGSVIVGENGEGEQSNPLGALTATLLRSANVNADVKWIRNGIAIAGGNASGNATNQLCNPYSLCIDDNQTVYIADC
ncbi:unnamed protein product [Rotaria sordida]|uniref:Uncharacterized protein n=2 Tax=Rotaria sordida TaxID=392033 RepID=A0A814R5W4_9BILA|nr:unnamed protein product [Rotaria sordida]CAF1350331.1 unnamed protein product [Rotaria sordida]